MYFKYQDYARIHCLEDPVIIHNSVGRDATFILREGKKKKNLYFICYTANFTLGNCIQLYYCPEQ